MSKNVSNSSALPGRHSFFIKRTSASNSSKIPLPTAIPSTEKKASERPVHEPKPRLEDHDDEDDLANFLTSSRKGGYSAASSAAASPRSVSASPNTFDTPNRNRLLSSVLNSLEVYELSDHEQAAVTSTSGPRQPGKKDGPLPPYHYHYHNHAGSDSDTDVPVPSSSSPSSFLMDTAPLDPTAASGFLLAARGAASGGPGLPRAPGGTVGQSRVKGSQGATRSAGSFGFGAPNLKSSNRGVEEQKVFTKEKSSRSSSQLSDSDDGMEREERQLQEQVSTLKRQLRRSVPTVPWTGTISPTNLPSERVLNKGIATSHAPMPGALPSPFVASASVASESPETFCDDYQKPVISTENEGTGSGDKSESHKLSLKQDKDPGRDDSSVTVASASSTNHGDPCDERGGHETGMMGMMGRAGFVIKWGELSPVRILACATEAAKRAWKRQPVAVFMCGLVMVLLLGGLGGILWARSMESRAVFQKQGLEAEKNAVLFTTREVEDFLQREHQKWEMQLYRQLQQQEQARQAQRQNHEHARKGFDSKHESSKDDIADKTFEDGESLTTDKKRREAAGTGADMAMVLHPGACPCDGIPLFKIVWGRLARTLGRLVRFLDRHGRNRGRVRT